MQEERVERARFIRINNPVPAGPPMGEPWWERKLMVVPVLFAINLVVFLMFQLGSQSLDELLARHFFVSMNHLKAGHYWTLVTAAFSHYMFLHFALNMMVLFSFGSLLERFMGKRRFLTFYLTAAVVSSLSHAVTSTLLMHAPGKAALGASGALCGLMMVFAMLFPKQKLVLFFIIPIPAKVGVLLLAAFDVYGLIAQGQGHWPPIGHGAHLGGSLCGLLYYFLLIRPRLSGSMRQALG